MRKFFLTYIVLLTAVWASAQSVATGLPYECSFEEGENLAAWTLNYGTANPTDKWIYGTAVHSEGRRSMYISADGANPCYGKNKNIVVSMLRYKFPTSSSKQSYTVSFDWKGVGDSAISKLYVLLCREQDMNDIAGPNLSNLVSTTTGQLSNDIIRECQYLGEPGSEGLFLCGSETWRNVTFTNDININAANSQRNFVFLFIWANGNTRDSVTNTSIAIDNFQINSARIKKPSNVVVYPQCEDSSLLVTWETSGAANSFDIQYRKTGDTEWTRGVSGISEGMEGFVRTDGTHCSYSIKPILEGSYDLRIRSAYYDDATGQSLRSNYVYQTNIFVYCPENHCINYVDLYGPNVTCTYGYHPHVQSGNPYETIGVIDYGPDAIESRHTLHVDPTELDPRTDSLLHTVPTGALASVRLGNWNWGGEAESISYDILVDSTNQGILIVRYAIVFENPGGHPKDDEPAFQLDVLDQAGNPIDLTCGHADFTFSDADGATGWHMTADDGVAWKEWTTIGVNLMPYHGQNIKVRFTTLDCGYSGHYAYAYFTVDCANAHIETENCGNDAHVTCMAPDGFAYAWYNQNGDTVSHDQTFIVEASRQVYTCRVSFKEKRECYFEISTTSEPRFPVPSYTVDSIFENCMSKLKFTNTSHVMNKFDGYENHTSESANMTQWTFRRLSDGLTKRTTAWSPEYICPEKGDSIEVTCTTYIGVNNSCDSTRVDTIVMPSIYPRDSSLHITTCSEEPVKFDGKWFDADTVYRAVTPNFAGCDSIATLYLRVFPKPQDMYRHDSICSDQSVVINGVRYNQPLDKYPIIMKTINGCDSVLYFTLTVNYRLDADIYPVPFACADDQVFYITYDINHGVYDSLFIQFDTDELRDTMIYDPNINSVAIHYPDSILPGQYKATLTFYQFCCGPRVEERYIDVRYKSAIVEQKWNDVLTVLAPKYNGGYEFTGFQWYKNDMPLAGETRAYLYQPLDTEAEYYVVVTRPDGTSMATCPVHPVYRPQQSEYPTIVPAGNRVPVYMEQKATVWYYTVSGQLYATYTLPQGYTALTTPDQQGVYVLKATTEDGETKSQVMIVQ